MKIESNREACGLCNQFPGYMGGAQTVFGQDSAIGNAELEPSVLSFCHVPLRQYSSAILLLRKSRSRLPVSHSPFREHNTVVSFLSQNLMNDYTLF